MQQALRPIPHNRYQLSGFAVFTLLTFGAAVIAVCALSGCDAPPPPEARQPKKPFAGATLALSCPDAAFADAIAPMVETWAVRTGATVTVSRVPMTATDSTDLAVIPTGALGEWGEAGLLAPVPAKLRTGEQFQWQGLLPAYGERLSEWAGQTLAVPLTGDGHVLVYRADKIDPKRAPDPAAAKAVEANVAEFQKRYNRPLAAPATWEELADVAAFFADRDKKPSLPPLPADPDRLFDLFARVAASADRRALNDVEIGRRAGTDRDALAFQYFVTTGKPRLQTPGFRFAANWLAKLHAAKAVPAEPGALDDPVAALNENRAVFALLSLDQLAKLQREGAAVSDRFAVAAVPGTREYHDPNRPKSAEPPPKDAAPPPPNYVPYFSGGRLGVVRARCQNQEAAFDLLADLGGPARSAELVGTPGIGAGPVRGAHTTHDRLVLWLAYGFDEPQSKRLLDALRFYVGEQVKNPTFGPRAPDRAAVVATVADPLRAVARGAVPPDDGLKRANDAWDLLDSKVPTDTIQRWRRRCAGLN